ncbi:hypothetical protein MPTK1_3g15970 [Marchantia polymorpha subsp. ruderalis]|uniref:Uncharacterized protein n=3 Tax=Marchantia polymorpha TaxID=3197 RepID=A0A176VC72_MARPO|nr:hypothetical protein AXG93_4101s1000 [Marchantia polymorpha subsp. ruderalis]
MAATMCLRSVPSLSYKALSRPSTSTSSGASRRAFVRCDAGSNGKNPLGGLKESVDRATKTPITKEDILQNQEQNQSEKQSVFGAVPNSGSFYPRPEIERRPETGSKSFGSVFAFDGAAPETINGRLAMMGFVWALCAEKLTGLTVMEQIFNPATSGLVFFVAAVQLFTYASMVPIMNGESTDARSWGPFNARAERWNGRLAMIGFAALLIDEMIRQGPLIH